MTEIDDKRVEAAARALKTLTLGPFGPNALALLSGGYKVQLDGGEAEDFARVALAAADAEVVDRLARARAWIVTCVDPAQVGVETKQAMLDYVDGKRDLPADVSAVTTTPEMVDEDELATLEADVYARIDPEGHGWAAGDGPGVSEVLRAVLAAGYRRHDPDEVRREKADAWDEGARAGLSDAGTDGWRTSVTPNPYREAGQ